MLKFTYTKNRFLFCLKQNYHFFNKKSILYLKFLYIL